MNKPNFNEIRSDIMPGRGDLGIKRIPSAAIPKQGQGGPTRTGNAKTNFSVDKKMKKVMKKVMGG